MLAIKLGPCGLGNGLQTVETRVRVLREHGRASLTRGTWMWCNVCQSDVVTELTADNSRAVCATCGQVLSSVAAAHPAAPVHNEQVGPRVEARELLDRWASNHLFDPYGPPRKNVEPTAESDASPTNYEFGSDALQTTPFAQPPPIAPLQVQHPQANAVPPVSHTPQPRATNGGAEPLAITAPAVAYPPVPRGGSSLPEVVPQPPSPVVRPPIQETAQSSAATGPAEDSSTDRNLQSSAAELDRLTNEILSRVSQISEDRRQRIEVAAAELPTEANLDFEPASEFAGGIDLTRRVDTEHHTRPSHFDSIGSRESDETAVAPSVSETTSPVTPVHNSTNPVSDTETHTSPEPDRRTIEANTSTSAGSGMPGIGQILSYIGILGLTAGTSFVIVGYFGGPPGYAPTGWLVATVGQMLLFLGIVTLVSNGIEQTSDELHKTVNSRIDELSGRLESIGDKLIRIEPAESGGPRRPHVLDRSDSRRPVEHASVPRENR